MMQPVVSSLVHGPLAIAHGIDPPAVDPPPVDVVGVKVASVTRQQFALTLTPPARRRRPPPPSALSMYHPFMTSLLLH